ncbi:glycosyltransferase family 2 protein [Candidatus Lucifugimonas marina]|uniref:glycosyltransferase family 2 protein n=1 Tax=Candidatus Lucifugimonas marina TaxID=3038979 RepID=UPI00319E161F
MSKFRPDSTECGQRAETSVSQPAISVLIATRNRPDALVECIESVLSQEFCDFELIILDDASDDPLRPIVSPRVDDSRICWIESDTPSGVAGARNRLVDAANSDILVFLDDDAVFTGDQNLSEVVREFADNPELGILAFRISLYSPDATELQVPFSMRIRKQAPDLTEQRVRASYFVGAAHAIKKSVFDICGRYTPDLVYGHEELELSYAAIDNGFEIVFSSKLRAVHSPMTTLISNSGGELYFEVRNRMWIAYRRLPIKYAVPYVLIWLGVYGLRSVKVRRPLVFIRGFLSGSKAVLRINREPVSNRAIQYLQANFGRLWY